MSMPQALPPQHVAPVLPSEGQGLRPRLLIVWSYLRHELLYICWALMDVALLAPAALALFPWTYFWPLTAFVAWLSLILLLPFNLRRWLALTGVAIERQRRFLLTTFFFVLVLSIRSLLFEPRSLLDLAWVRELFGRALAQPALLWQRELGLFGLLAMLWWRGLALTRRHVVVTEVGFRMRLGGLLLVPLVLGLSLIPAAPNAIPFVMLFFLAALMAIALSRAEEVARQNASAAYPMNPRWVLTVFLTSLLIVSVAAIAGIGLSGSGLQQLLRWLTPLWDAVALGGMVIVTTTTYLLLFLLLPLQWLLRYVYGLLSGLGIEGLPTPEEMPPELMDPNIDQLMLDLGDSQSSLWMWANRGAIVLFVLVVLLILFVAVRRYFHQRVVSFEPGDAASQPEATASREGGIGRRIMQRFDRWRRWRAAATVRQLYRAMCTEAQARGYPRTLSQTPYEYLAPLAKAWPDTFDDVRLITDAYIRVRYGEVPESADELEALRHAWRRLAHAPLSEAETAAGPSSEN